MVNVYQIYPFSCECAWEISKAFSVLNCDTGAVLCGSLVHTCKYYLAYAPWKAIAGHRFY